MFENSWPQLLNDPNAPPALKNVAKELTSMKKIVFSKDRKDSDWNNTEFYGGDMAKTVKELKEKDENTIMIMGSGSIVQQLTNERLIDEYSFILSPVIAGDGKPLF